MKYILLIPGWLLFMAPAVYGQQYNDFEKKEFQYKGRTLPYRILYPRHYDPKKSYPLVLFLHGAGERGNDNEKQLTHGASLFLKHRDDFPAIVVFPQCPSDGYWSTVAVDRTRKPPVFSYNYAARRENWEASAVRALLKSLRSKAAPDRRRLYIVGLSMGGMGTFELISRHPKLFAAAIPICGGGDTTYAHKYARRLPLWIFHGADDSVVEVSYSRAMVSALKAAGGNVRYTEYPGVNHNSWDNAFAEPDFLPWLFAQKKP